MHAFYLNMSGDNYDKEEIPTRFLDFIQFFICYKRSTKVGTMWIKTSTSRPILSQFPGLKI